MKTIKIKGDYLENLRRAKPTAYKKTIKPPKGSMSAPKLVEYEIPPVNTDIQFGNILPSFSLSKHVGLAAMDMRDIPEIFDWRHTYPSDDKEIRRKKTMISKPGNQALCGSCWAISGAEIIADNFVVSNIVEWIPNLSTTWSLIAYPQNQCKGGNPAVLFNDVAYGGIVSNHCVDYSWCLKNEICNGSALQHFDTTQKNEAVSSLNSLIPTSKGCYNSTNKRLVYYIDPEPKTIFIGAPGITKENIASIVKKQIYTRGPVLGGFIVYKNFMNGAFTKTNKGVYLENATYDSDGNILDWENPKEYAGAHAVSIIGWGIAKNILTNKDKREDVHYWYCRNSWKDTWGDKGYFKMAMYPWNNIAQFENQVVVMNDKGGSQKAGGIVFVSASKKPVEKKLPQLPERYTEVEKMEDSSYYLNEPRYKPSVGSKDDDSKDDNPGDDNPGDQPNNSGEKKIPYLKVFLIILGIGIFALLVFLTVKFIKEKRGGKSRVRKASTRVSPKVMTPKVRPVVSRKVMTPTVSSKAKSGVSPRKPGYYP